MIHRTKPVLVSGMMFLGMLTGIAVLLFSKPSSSKSSLVDDLSVLSPWRLSEKQPVRASLHNLMSLWEASAAVSALQARDSLTAADSAEIKKLDKQLNELIHD